MVMEKCIGLINLIIKENGIKEFKVIKGKFTYKKTKTLEQGVV